MTNQAASVKDTKHAIDQALHGSGYSCKVVSWDDVSRATFNGGLSCWGSNITDTRLNAKDGTPLFTVRSENWNEKLGVIDAKQFALLVGNCSERKEGLRNITLSDFLRHPYSNGAAYTGIDSGVSLSADADAKVSIRFQTVFLPVSSNAQSERGTMQFATEAYNYSTLSDDDPRNLVLLATTQGLSVQADGAGSKRLFLHSRDENTSNINEYWLEAESSQHKVGGEQKESTAERADAIARGKATSEVIGIKAMGTRFNVLATIQIPLVQKPKPQQFSFSNSTAFGSFTFGAQSQPQQSGFGAPPSSVTFGNPPSQLMQAPTTFGATSFANSFGTSLGSGLFGANGPSFEETRLAATKSSLASRPPPPTGNSSAARVSRGDYHGPYSGLSTIEPKRNTKEHVTITCVLYNTVIGGVPSPTDCMAAVRDMDNLYAECTLAGKLADTKFDSMKSELTVANISDIQAKISSQVPTPSNTSPHGIVRSKLAELQAVSPTQLQKSDVLKLKLMTIGVLKNQDIKSLLVADFDNLYNEVSKFPYSDHQKVKQQFNELKLMIEGALSI